MYVLLLQGKATAFALMASCFHLRTVAFSWFKKPPEVWTEDPDVSQDPHSGGEEERSGLRGSL